MVSDQVQTRRGTQRRETASVSMEMPSKHRPERSAEILRQRILYVAHDVLGLDVKEAAKKAGTSHWNWYKKQQGEAFTYEQCVTFAESIGAPTLWPFYDWAHAEDLDKRFGWDK